MAIVVPHVFPDYGGHEYYLAKSLSRLGVDVILYTSDLIPSRYLGTRRQIQSPKEKLNGVLTRRLPSWIEVHGVPLTRGISKALSKDEPGLVHAQEYYKPSSLQSYHSSRRLGIPFIFTQHMYAEPIGIWKLAWLAVEKTVAHVVAENAAHITAVSHAAQDFLVQRGIPEEKISLVPLGVDTSVFNPKVSGEALRRELGLQDRKVVLFVGRLTRIKGVDLLARAFVKIHSVKPEVALVLVGSGDMKHWLKSFFKSSDVSSAVRMLDHVPHNSMPSVYAACDVFVMPSRREVFGLSLLEAMAHQKPVVASRVGGIPSIVTNGEEGLLVGSCNIEHFASAVILLLEDSALRTEMAIKALNRARELDYSSIARRTLAVYEKVLSSH